MPIDLTGIENKNEFYSTHYLHSILEDDVKKCVKKWDEEAEAKSNKAPPELLGALTKKYFYMREEYLKQGNPQTRLEIQREFFADLLNSIGYTCRPGFTHLEDGASLPILSEVNRANGLPDVWILEALQDLNEPTDILELKIVPEQFIGLDQDLAKCADCKLEDLITDHVFAQAYPPRWILIFSVDQLMLIDRTKWERKCSLSFDLGEIFNRKESSTIKAAAVLLHRELLSPASGESIHDEMDRNSHKHANAVSESLKYAIRDSIEQLANEAVRYLKDERKVKVYDTELAESLSIECLRYMYRLLFVFYLESRPELGYVPQNCEIYQKGYSLEALREHELVHLETHEGLNGYFLHESLERLFRLIEEGTGKQADLDFFQSSYHNSFKLAPLSSKLFDPAGTPTLNKVKFRNAVLQNVIKSMSLSRPKEKKERPGRISYSDLSIIQLGAVYESLLSFRGFFAETDLYEVKKADADFSEMEPGYFVQEKDLGHYTDDERLDKKGMLKKFERGRFIYRISGRDRQSSASYYTPEVLTECLIKSALNELITAKSADELLTLTICEPAMGSGAFLNAAVNQLAEAYLQKKQKETGVRIDHASYTTEKQKVKMYLSDRNIFGVDLNATAVELAEVSLWLNSIYKGAHVPWFGMQLANGNSLVGARLEVVAIKVLRKGSGKCGKKVNAFRNPG